MSPAIPYFDLIREMRNAFNHRLRLVAHAREHGIKDAVRFFHTTVPTVRKWVRCYQAQGLQGL
ncbi:MAG: helix-turn-helix domain-containing protein [Acidobacteria bacterium]|nr:helix-turn-helix domain-containing protein [Acidobacteriota bacterium]